MTSTSNHQKRLAAEFLKAHRNASFITVDTHTGLPYSATYSKGHPTPLGQIRVKDAIFHFHYFCEELLDTPPPHPLYSI